MKTENFVASLFITLKANWFASSFDAEERTVTSKQIFDSEQKGALSKFFQAKRLASPIHRRLVVCVHYS